jgi:demethylmacrocin O-methyltransferase
MSLKARIQDPLPPAYHRFVRRTKIWRLRNDLNGLAVLFKTDKWGSHWYTQHYQRYFQPLKHKRLNVLEIGVGGYEASAEGGASLRMWKAYFRKSRILGIDLYDKTQFREHRIDIRQCDQTDSDALARLSNEYGGFDIIIDDGSHLNDHVIKTFHTLFPLMRPGGIYVVEDTQTAYWPTWGGGISDAHTSMAFLKGLADGLNHVEFPVEDYKPTYFDKNVVEIAFFHNLVFIRKGNNDEKPNDPRLIKKELAVASNRETREPCVPDPCQK